MTSSGIPALLAVDLEPRTRNASHLSGDSRSHSSSRERESFACARIQTELEKPGFVVNLATVSRYLPKRGGNHDQLQRWTTFLQNHRDVISAMVSLVVSTIRFKMLFVWFVVTHGRREAFPIIVMGRH